MKRDAFAVLAATAIAAVAPQTAAETVVLKFATVSPPNSSAIKGVFQPWVDKVNADAGDAIRIQMFHGFAVANRTNSYERVMSDVVQIGFSGPYETGGRFPRSDVVTLPFLADNSQVAATAFWKIYAKGVLAAEYKDTHPFMLGVYTNAVPHFNKREVRKQEDFRGLKVRISSRVGASTVEALGAAAIQMGADDTYKALERSTIDGVLTSWGAITQQKMVEVTSWHVETPMGASSAWLQTSKKTYDALPEKGRKALDANSGEALSSRFGAWHEKLQTESKEFLRAAKGHTIFKLAPDEEARWVKAAEPVVAEFLKSTPDGAAVLAAYREAVAGVKASMKR
jgi:TRAP-type C4-dicarboxylate transport system substrate-binding protein